MTWVMIRQDIEETDFKNIIFCIMRRVLDVYLQFDFFDGLKDDFRGNPLSDCSESQF